jgi:hypothetical protein
MQTKKPNLIQRMRVAFWRIGYKFRYSQTRAAIASIGKYAIWMFYLLRAFVFSRGGSLRSACDTMFTLNAWAVRNKGYAARWVYELKNHLVRYLYERGYCVAVTEQTQEIKCWGECVYCYENEDGESEYEYECGPHCRRCGGTGVYKRHVLYRFIFHVGGQTFVWHQPQSLVNWNVTPTDPTVGEYRERDAKPAPKRDGKWALVESLRVWWALALRRCAPRLPLLNPFMPPYFQRAARYDADGNEIYSPRGYLYVPFLCLLIEWQPRGTMRLNVSFPVVPHWRMDSSPFLWYAARWQPDWLAFHLYDTEHNHDWVVIVAGKSIQQWTHYPTLIRRVTCLLKGHTFARETPGNSRYCTRCYAENVHDH